MIGDILKSLFGSNRNVISETVEAFRPNAEAQAKRDFSQNHLALNQFGQEFRHSTVKKSWFDSLMDGVNRIPRPLLALGVIGLFVTAMISPAWFAVRMVGLAAVPEPLWWLLGMIVAFYFGGRHQTKTQTFDLEKQVAAVPLVLESQRVIEGLTEQGNETVGLAEMSDDEYMSAMKSQKPLTNSAIAEWNRRNVDEE